MLDENPLGMLAIALIIPFVGSTLLRQAQEADETGIAHFTWQYPNNISRESNPIGFRWNVFVNRLVGYFTYVWSASTIVALTYRAVRGMIGW